MCTVTFGEVQAAPGGVAGPRALWIPAARDLASATGRHGAPRTHTHIERLGGVSLKSARQAPG